MEAHFSEVAPNSPSSVELLHPPPHLASPDRPDPCCPDDREAPF